MSLLPGLTKGNVAGELMAGVTLVAIAVPLNIGYATIAGVNPVNGLYALILPCIVYALIVSSRQVVVSPDAAAAALVASSVGGLVAAGDSEKYLFMVFAQAIICGVILLALGFFKLGFLANFLSEPILIGFVAGLALDILLSQVAKMLGIHLEGEEFLAKLGHLLTHLDEVKVWSVIIAVASLALLVIPRKFLPKVPWPLFVLIGGTIWVTLAHFTAEQVKTLGKVDAGLPSITIPHLSVAEWLSLAPSALALAAVTTAEGLLVARSYAEKNRYPDDPDRDLIAFGAANVAAGFTGGLSAGSSTSRTAAMDQAGSRTQLPSLVVAGVTVLLLLFGTGLLENIPNPAIGAIVAVAVVPLLKPREFARLWKLDRYEFGVAAVCFLVTLLVGSIPGILVAAVLAMINVIRHASKPAVDVLAEPADARDAQGADAPLEPVHRLTKSSTGLTAPGVLLIRIAAPLFFANANVVVQAIKDAVTGAGSADEQAGPEGGADDRVRHVVLDAEAVTDIDVTAAEAFEGLREWLTERDITLSYSRVRERQLEHAKHFGLIEPDDRVFASNREALAVLGEVG
ncbi:sulfate transporter [Gordonia araii NBRC 100433]|uniref:Sulfate transporter n=1 Tax=Gordonia araii NBRC 100433 TaxID=1073574 RepID=G7GYG8_9ACTN|nr:SulP family inorganic anion transporter [Gordonia araii]NNG97360.1 SulP family inorganic anion transporter [Gordonia araii NBRC 100433]GAB08643.1 sulfate transporter [Gordonia araii NBRC 100433]